MEQHLILKHTFKKEDFSPDIGHRIKSSLTAILARVWSGILKKRKVICTNIIYVPSIFILMNVIAKAVNVRMFKFM